MTWSSSRWDESQEALAAAGEETRHAKKQAREVEEARLQSEKEAEENVVLARQEDKGRGRSRAERSRRSRGGCP